MSMHGYSKESATKLVYSAADIYGWDESSITCRSMFSGFQFFLNDVVFLRLYDGTLYVRVSELLLDQWLEWGSKAFVTKAHGSAQQVTQGVTLADLASRKAPLCNPPSTRPRSTPIADFWYSIPDLYSSHDQLSPLLFESYLISKQGVLARRVPTRLRDLPNISLSINRMLREVNIRTISTLRTKGHNLAFLELNRFYGDVSLHVLHSIYGALTNTHYCAISKSRRQELSEDYAAFALNQAAKAVSTKASSSGSLVN